MRIFTVLLAGGAVMAQTTGEPFKLAEGFQFCEGPSYERSTGYLYVVNCQSDNIHRVYPDGRIEVFAKALGSGNGSTFAKDGTLWVCDYKRKAIVRFDRSGKPEIMAEGCEGTPFLGPNDLCFDSKGNLYFTDPAGSWDRPIGAVYRRNADGRVQRLAEGLQFPNGIALSRDEKWLYVAESPRNRILRWQIRSDGTLGEMEVFIDLPPPGGPDGMRFDSRGNLWVAQFGAGKILVVSPDGKVWRSYPAGGRNPTNVEFGGKDNRTLYITETETNAVYTIRAPYPGFKRW